MVLYDQTGYCGCSMSERAREAYSDGERPLSKWSKRNIIDEVLELSDERFSEDELMKFTKQTLIKAFLYRSSWHHTSKFANETDFYSLDEERINSLDIEDLQKIQQTFRTQKQQTNEPEIKKIKGQISYDEWEGSRNYGKFVNYTSYCVIIGDWAYLPDGSKKSRLGSHCKVTNKFSRAPRGTSHIFKQIEKNLPKKYK